MRDRMRAALIYISEYAETKRMMTEGRYNNEELLLRLRAVFGRVDQVRDNIDRALQQDDAHHRKRNMRFLILPTRFPRPESMGQGDIDCSLLLHGFWDLISICSCSEFCIDQLQIPFGVQSTDATANGGLAPKPPESGWYPRCFLYCVRWR